MDEDDKYNQWSLSADNLLKSQFPMHCACRDGDMETLNSLLSSGDHDLFEEDTFYGWTPVHWAAHFGKLTCLMRLLEHGASFDSTTERFNQTPSHIAAFGGKGHCLKWLLHCGAMINRQLACLRKLTSLSNDGVLCHLATSRFGQSPLHLASLRDHPHCAQWIIQSGTNIEVQDYLGETPVHKAARTGSMECVSLLVSQGCKLSIRNHHGRTPSQLAAECGHQECANYLERASQMQQQASEVYSELRTPVTQTSPPTTNMMPSMVGNNRSDTDPCVIMQGLNGGIVPFATTENISMPANDCDMDDIELVGDNGMHEEMNILYRAGVKRGRDELEEECFKRMRKAGPGQAVDGLCSVCPNPLPESYILNNNHLETPISSSALEHYTSLSIQQGYDSLLMDSLILNAHGS